MHIPIPIPIGVKRVVTVEGAVWKFVSCANCQQDFGYLMRLQANGEDHDLLFLDMEGSIKRAEASAEQNLAKKCHNVVLPVPCPNCGFYQEDMVNILKEEGSSNGYFTAGLVLATLSLVPLAFSIPHIWIVTAAGVLTGLLLMGYADLAASRYDPNAGDPEPRKLHGRKHAVWGEQLVNLLATRENAESSD